MQIEVDIGFEQLLRIVKKLPSGQLKQLKAEIDRKTPSSDTAELESLLLLGPVATKKQLEIIDKNKKAINQWRAK